MTLIKWNPVRDVSAWHPVSDFDREFVNMQREIDRMFDRFRGGVVDDNGAPTWLPAVDVVENANHYLVKAELPGVDKKDVKITIQNDVLIVRGEKKKESEKKDENYHRVERSYGVFQRSFTLPTSVKSEAIEASYDQGVLTITLPKAEEAKPKEIEVRVK
ncbi:MAG TPA: Hsp20/alpha crystallin family protein [Bacteroidota bacterium]|jgi:HSP20 family protein|nr:Hsp20/alpha crystallin family protein [Bacteroidota bacterium]